MICVFCRLHSMSKPLLIHLRLSLLSFLLLLAGCASEPKFDLNTAEGAYKRAQFLEKEERYEEAILQYNEVKNKFPYSKLSTEAELRVADIQFERGTYIESQVSYQLFKELHPKHPLADYVTYQIGMSYFNQLPSTIDRDLSVSKNAIIFFDELTLNHPQSKWFEKAKETKLKILKMLAEKENYIAHFYFIREKYDSALGRYETLIQKYKGLGFDQKALYGAAYSAYKIKDFSKTKQYYDELLEKHKDSDEAKQIQQEIEHELR